MRKWWSIASTAGSTQRRAVGSRCRRLTSSLVRSEAVSYKGPEISNFSQFKGNRSKRVRLQQRAPWPTPGSRAHKAGRTVHTFTSPMSLHQIPDEFETVSCNERRSSGPSAWPHQTRACATHLCVRGHDVVNAGVVPVRWRAGRPAAALPLHAFPPVVRGVACHALRQWGLGSHCKLH